MLACLLTNTPQDPFGAGMRISTHYAYLGGRLCATISIPNPTSGTIFAMYLIDIHPKGETVPCLQISKGAFCDSVGRQAGFRWWLCCRAQLAWHCQTHHTKAGVGSVEPQTVCDSGGGGAELTGRGRACEAQPLGWRHPISSCTRASDLQAVPPHTLFSQQH